MSTSSITHNFVLSTEEQVERFADAIERSYQESLTRKPTCDFNIHYIRDPEEVRAFMEDFDKKWGIKND